jgi:hypothetical protein
MFLHIIPTIVLSSISSGPCSEPQGGMPPPPYRFEFKKTSSVANSCYWTQYKIEYSDWCAFRYVGEYSVYPNLSAD